MKFLSLNYLYMKSGLTTQLGLRKPRINLVITFQWWSNIIPTFMWYITYSTVSHCPKRCQIIKKQMTKTAIKLKLIYSMPTASKIHHTLKSWGHFFWWRIHTSIKFYCQQLLIWTPTTFRRSLNTNIDGLVQERCNSSALAMELRLSCTKLSICALIEILQLWGLYLIYWNVLQRGVSSLRQNCKVDVLVPPTAIFIGQKSR